MANDIERANGYLETSFLPGRTFTRPQDFNDQLHQWLALANTRMHRRLGCRPVDRWAADVAAMVALPPTAPAVGWASTIRLGRDHYVRLDPAEFRARAIALVRAVKPQKQTADDGVCCRKG